MKTTKMLGKFGGSWRNLVPDGLKFAMFLVLGVAIIPLVVEAETRYYFSQSEADANGNYKWTNPANWGQTDKYPGDSDGDGSDAWVWLNGNRRVTIDTELKPIWRLSAAYDGAWVVVTNGGSVAVKSTCVYGNTLVSGNGSNLWNTNDLATINDGYSFIVNDGGVVTAGGSQSGKRGYFFNNRSSTLVDGGAFTNNAFYAVLRNNATLTVRNGGAFYKGSGSAANPFFFGNRDAVETSTNSEIRVESRGLFKANVLSFGDGNDTVRDNRVIVTGEGSILWCFSAADNASGIRVYGTRNSIEVSDGALLSCVRSSTDPLYTGTLSGQNPWGDILLGVGNTPDPSGDDNTLTVDDAMAFVRGNVVIGSSGSGNRVTLRNGASMRLPKVSSFPISLRIGDSAASVSNVLSIADSALYVNGSIVVGVNGGFSRLELAGNAIITNTESSTGFVFGQNSSSNRLEVKAGGNLIVRGRNGSVRQPVVFTNDTVLAFTVLAGGYGGKPGLQFRVSDSDNLTVGKISFADLGRTEFDVKAWAKGGAQKGDSVTLMSFTPVSQLNFTNPDGTVVADTSALTALAERLQADADAGDAPVKITAENGTDIVCTYRGAPGLAIFVR